MSKINMNKKYRKKNMRKYNKMEMDKIIDTFVVTYLMNILILASKKEYIN